MEYLIGVGVAAAVYVFALVSGFDRERVFYPTVLIVVGHYYILFAAMGGSTPVLALESLAAAVFLALAVIGFKNSLWLTFRFRRTRNLRPLSQPTDSESTLPRHV